MPRRKREIVGLTNERDFPHLVELGKGTQRSYVARGRVTSVAARPKRAGDGETPGGGGKMKSEHQPHATPQTSDVTIFRASRINDLSRRRCSLASAVKWPCR